MRLLRSPFYSLLSAFGLTKTHMRTTALEVRTYITNMARSTSGEVAGLSSQLGRVRIPHESLNRNQESGVRFQAMH